MTMLVGIHDSMRGTSASLSLSRRANAYGPIRRAQGIVSAYLTRLHIEHEQLVQRYWNNAEYSP